MKESQRLVDEREFVARSLGDSVICHRCRATLDTFAVACTAGLGDACQGFLEIEEAREKFSALRAERGASDG
jgi:hypothetical protein